MRARELRLFVGGRNIIVGHGIQANQGGSEVKTGGGQWGKKRAS